MRLGTRVNKSTSCLSRYGATISPRPTGSGKLVSDDLPVFHGMTSIFITG
jgi:hypothetical protein